MKTNTIFRRVFNSVMSFLLVVLLLVGCAKTFEVEQGQTEQTYFYITFSSTNDTYGTFVDELPNGDIIVAGAWQTVGLDPRVFVAKRTDAYGNIIWEKEIAMNKEFYCQGSVMSNGDYVFNSIFASTEVIRITPDGEILFHAEFNPTLSYSNIISLPAEGENGSVLISHSNGAGTGGSSSNYIITIDLQGNNERVQKLEDYDFNARILAFRVLKYVDGEYWITGFMFVAPFTGWSDPMKTFVAKIRHGSRCKTSA